MTSSMVQSSSEFKENFKLPMGVKYYAKMKRVISPKKKAKITSASVDSQEVRASIDNETRLSSPSHSSSSLNDSNFMESEGFKTDIKKKNFYAENAMNQHQINDILEKLSVQAAKMNLKSSYSNAYKEIVNSFLNENLISYSKQYESYLDEKPQVTKINHPSELENEDKLTEIKFEKRPVIIKQKQKRILSINNVSQTITKYNPNSRIDSHSTVNEDQSTSNSKKSRPSTKLSFTPRSVSSFSMQHSKASANGKQSSLGKSPSEPTHRLRVTDLILQGYTKEDKFKELENYEHNDLNNHKFMNKSPLGYLTPSFTVPRFNLTEPSELKLAKQDIYKRYSFINNPENLAQNLSYTVRTKILSQLPKKAIKK